MLKIIVIIVVCVPLGYLIGEYATKSLMSAEDRMCLAEGGKIQDDVCVPRN